MRAGRFWWRRRRHHRQQRHHNARRYGPHPLRGGFHPAPARRARPRRSRAAPGACASGSTLRYDRFPDARRCLGFDRKPPDPGWLRRDPAAARSAISVGAFRSRLLAEAQRGQGQLRARRPTASRPSSSGIGARRPLCPDIPAPGEFIVTTLSIDALHPARRARSSPPLMGRGLPAGRRWRPRRAGAVPCRPRRMSRRTGAAAPATARSSASLQAGRALAHDGEDTGSLRCPRTVPRRGFGLLRSQGRGGGCCAAVRRPWARSAAAVRSGQQLRSADRPAMARRSSPSRRAMPTVCRWGRGIRSRSSDAGSFTGPVATPAARSDSFGRYDARCGPVVRGHRRHRDRARVDGITLQRRLRLSFVSDGIGRRRPYVLGGCSYSASPSSRSSSCSGPLGWSWLLLVL